MSRIIDLNAYKKFYIQLYKIHRNTPRMTHIVIYKTKQGRKTVDVDIETTREMQLKHTAF